VIFGKCVIWWKALAQRVASHQLPLLLSHARPAAGLATNGRASWKGYGLSANLTFKGKFVWFHVCGCTSIDHQTQSGSGTTAKIAAERLRQGVLF
jgi:hypothetical protein